jgi:ParB/RepB/Spo0J family partition protein
MLERIMGVGAGMQAREAMGEGKRTSEPEAPRDFLRRTREALAKRRERLYNGGVNVEKDVEASSKMLLDVRMIPLSMIRADAGFQNLRLFDDPMRESEGGTAWTLEGLQASIKADGLKVPIAVVEKANGTFAVRAGFRRWKCIKRLMWTEVPAVVLPANMTLEDEYWVNILENATRKSLTTYELARSAKIMRDEFEVSASDFARRTGNSQGYVSKMLSCMDNLPEILIDHWKNGTMLTFDEWYKLSCLDHIQAIRTFHHWMGLTLKRRDDEPKDGETQGEKGKQLAPAWWMMRLQRLYLGIAGSDKLPPRTRDLVLLVVEYCMGQRDLIPGVYDPTKQKDYERRAQLRNELRMPELPDPGDEGKEMGPPKSETDDDDENEDEDEPTMLIR